MKVISIDHYGGSSDLVLRDVTIPEITADQVLVRVEAAGVNHIDRLKASGVISHVYPLVFPWIPGTDFSGTVVRVGELVQHIKPGDEVYGSVSGGGTYAEYLAVAATLVAKKPVALSHVEAAAIPMAAETAYQGLFCHGRLVAGQTVLILGAGGAVGTCAVQLASQAGVHVIALAAGVQAEELLQLGATQVIDYETEDPFLYKRKVDVVFDLVGGDLQDRVYQLVKREGVLVAANRPPDMEKAADHGVQAVFMHAAPTSSTLDHFTTLIDSGRLHLNVAGVHPLEEAGSVWDMLQANLHTPGDKRIPDSGKPRGKYVLRIAHQ